ncbi:MAG: substrate-binding periplasmic protein [Candidatus Adiutrix sp.]
MTCSFSSATLADSRLYRVAVELSYPPFAFVNENTGEMNGFDPDIAAAICDYLNINCEVVGLPFDEIIEAVESGQIDIGCAGMAHTEERATRVIFTERYFRSSSIFLEWPGTFKDATIDSLTGAKVAVQGATTQEAYLQAIYGDAITLVALDSFDEVVALLQDKKVDAAFVDSLPGYHHLKSDDGVDLDLLGEAVHIGSGSRMILTKGLEPLRDRINEAIGHIRLNGTYDTINMKYFDFNIY